MIIPDNEIGHMFEQKWEEYALVLEMEEFFQREDIISILDREALEKDVDRFYSFSATLPFLSNEKRSTSF